MTESTIQLAAIFELLGRLWLKEIDLETLEALGTNQPREAYEELGGFLPSKIDSATIEGLAVEYCELLIGPKGQISPVESVWVEDQLQSTTASSMHRFFELLPGYQPPSGFPDHIGVQLDFAGALLRIAQPIEDQSEAADEALTHFARKHFGWMSKFLLKIISNSDSEFYRGLATVTENLIQQIEKPNL